MNEQIFDDCTLILSFMKEFGLPYEEASLDIVRSLYDSSNKEIAWWKKNRHRRQWLKDIQDINELPNIEDILDVKGVIERTIAQYLRQYY